MYIYVFKINVVYITESLTCFNSCLNHYLIDKWPKWLLVCLVGLYIAVYMFVRPCCLIIYWRSIVALTTSSHSTGSTQTKLENPLPDTEAPTTQQNTQRERHGNSRIFCQSFWRIFISSFFSSK